MKTLYFLIITGLIITSGCTNKNKKKPDKTIPPKFVVSEEPKFKDEGDLWFISSENDTIKKIEIEIADSFKDRETGLMNRKSMKENHGMFFVFNNEERQSFWMKNTDIPLDLVFVNADKRIVHIAENCKPYSLDPITSFEYAQYVVEVNAGFCDKHSIKVGDYIIYKRN